MRFKEFLEALEDPAKKAELDSKRKEITPIKTKDIKVKGKIDPRLDPNAPVDPGNKTQAAMNLKALLGQAKYDKKRGHIGSVASAAGVYPT